LVQLIFIVNFCSSIFIGKKIGRNPWNSTTMEWDTPSPPGHGNFDKPIAAYRGPYEYSVPGAPEDFTPQSQPTAATLQTPHTGEPALAPAH
jgi:cytochrome c oxidase subunit 1